MKQGETRCAARITPGCSLSNETPLRDHLSSTDQCIFEHEIINIVLIGGSVETETPLSELSGIFCQETRLANSASSGRMR